MLGPAMIHTLVWLWLNLQRIDGFATQSTWVASNATGTLAGCVIVFGALDQLNVGKNAANGGCQFVGGVTFCLLL